MGIGFIEYNGEQNITSNSVECFPSVCLVNIRVGMHDCVAGKTSLAHVPPG